MQYVCVRAYVFVCGCGCGCIERKRVVVLAPSDLCYYTTTYVKLIAVVVSAVCRVCSSQPALQRAVLATALSYQYTFIETRGLKHSARSVDGFSTCDLGRPHSYARTHTQVRMSLRVCVCGRALTRKRLRALAAPPCSQRATLGASAGSHP